MPNMAKAMGDMACRQRRKEKVILEQNNLTGHDAVFGPKKFGDLADFDGAVDVLHNIIWKGKTQRRFKTRAESTEHSTNV